MPNSKGRLQLFKIYRYVQPYYVTFMPGMFNSTKLINSNTTLTCLCCEPRRHALLAFCASSTNGNRILLPMLRPRTIKTCWTAVTFDSRAVPVLDYPLITEPG